MGSCISKCTPKKHSHKEDQEDQVDHQQQLSNEIQDKPMVISQIPPKTPTQILFPLVNQNKFVSPSKTPPYASPSHSTSTSSVSSFITCTTSKTSVSSSSTSMCSSASSAISSKDKSSFSNEFLRSCYKENPHIARINSLKKAHCAPQNKPPTCPQKRVRSNSPINSSASLTRQKSFRIDQSPRDYQNFSALRSPSPSRRFGNYQNGEKLFDYHSKRLSSSSSSMGSNYNSTSFSRREYMRPSSPNHTNLSRSGLRNTREQRNIHRVGSKIDEIAVANALARNEIDNLLLVDDIDNPLISLDCFIFI